MGEIKGLSSSFRRREINKAIMQQIRVGCALCAGRSNRGRGGYIREIRGEAAELCAVEAGKGGGRRTQPAEWSKKGSLRQQDDKKTSGYVKAQQGVRRVKPKRARGWASANGGKYETGSSLVWEEEAGHKGESRGERVDGVKDGNMARRLVGSCGGRRMRPGEME